MYRVSTRIVRTVLIANLLHRTELIYKLKFYDIMHKYFGLSATKYFS